MTHTCHYRLFSKPFLRKKGMEVITMESEVFKEIKSKIDAISDYVLQQDKGNELSDDTWLDNYEVCTYLQISTRTLQRFRSENLITYSVIRGKIFYQFKEIKRLLNDNLIRREKGYLDDLVSSHKKYVEQREKNRR